MDFFNIYFAMFLLFGYVIISMSYVYIFRGQTRYENISEYLRKGWPITTPFNCLLYIFTQKRAAKAIIDPADFKELDIIKENWEVIREEVMKLHSLNHIENTASPDSAAYYDLGFRTFYKYGWSKFYLTWYGNSVNSAKKYCPKSVEILEAIPSVSGAMITVLPPGSQLTRHLDPAACSLRYHLGLSTPNSNDCFINVDGQQASWRDGEVIMFDETFLHFVQNNTDKERVILMCDIERPMSWPGKIINFFYGSILKLSLVPNMKGDESGLINSIFSGMAPILAKSKHLKSTNRPAYLLLKYSVNFTLLLIVIAIIYGIFKLLGL